THNLAINYTETLLRENDFILGRAAAFFARNDERNRAVNGEPDNEKSVRRLEPVSIQRFAGAAELPAAACRQAV
ncbi:hypothetical protein F6S25_32320, partial [Klebsiella pneumoniae]|nr:hypothetical protein [Klebsiella pneumoniae]